MQRPVDLSNIEQIVESLYTKNDPVYIRDTQSQLQSIQRSDQGWEMADLLLKSGKPVCQFFGALTFTVRINSMTDDEIKNMDEQQLLGQLLQWMIYHKQHNAPRFVLQKIISTLSIFFAKFPSSWPQCVESVIASLQYGHPVINADEQPANAHETSDADLVQGLWFCETLLQDLGNVNQASLTKTQQMQTNDILLKNLACASALMKRALDKGSIQNKDDDTLRIILHGIETLGTWIAYFRQSSIDTTDLQPFSEYLLHYLRYPPDEDIYSAVSTVVTDTYAYRPSFWPAGFKEEFIKVLLEQGHGIDDNEQVDEKIMGYTSMIVAFCELFSKQCMEREGQFSDLMDLMVKLTALPGTPAVDDCSISNQLLEFWTSHVEEYLIMEDDVHNRGPIKQLLGVVVSGFWGKIQLPDEDLTSDWNTDNWDEFFSFRRDFCDFLELIYPLVGQEFLNLLIANTVDYLKQEHVDWVNVECSIFCLNGTTEALSEKQKAEIRYIFESPLFDRLRECNRKRVHYTVVQMIGGYDEFFQTEQGKPYITSALGYLFKSLNNSELSVTSSKSIYKLCDVARGILQDLLPDFMSVYESMAEMPDLNSAAHERTVCAIACVVQSLQNINTKAEYLERLISNLVNQIQVEASKGADVSIEKIVSLIKCLGQIGKGLQVPDTIDVSIETPEHVAAREFWNRDERGIRSKMIQVISGLSIEQSPFNQQVDVCEACCDMLKYGFRETLPNPFTFPGDVVLEYIRSKYAQGPPTTLGVITDTACCFLTSQSMPKDENNKAQVVRTILDIFFSNPGDTDDPDVQTNKIKLLTQVLRFHSEVLLQHPLVRAMMELTVNLLESENKLVITEASKFWIQLLNDPNLGSVYNAAASQLCRVLVNKVSGGAARSDLHQISMLLRRVVAKYPQITKQYITEYVINNPSNASLARRDATARERFVRKLFVTGGGPQLFEVVKDFWMECRGLTY